MISQIFKWEAYAEQISNEQKRPLTDFRQEVRTQHSILLMDELCTLFDALEKIAYSADQRAE